MDWVNTLRQLLSALDEMVRSASGMHGALIPTGEKFLAVALILTLVSDWYQFWIRGDAQEMLSRMFRLFVVASIPFTMVAVDGNWAAFNKTLINFFQSGITQELGAAAGGSISEIITGTMRQMVSAISVTPAATAEGGFELTSPSTWGEIGNSIGNAASAVGGYMTEFVLKIIVYLGVTLMALAMLVAGYIPLVALQVGVIIGPILVVWLPFEPMANYAHTWLKFMIANAMTFVVAIVLLLIAKSAITSVNGVLNGMFSDGAGFAGSMAAIFIVLAVMVMIAYMLFQADDIAGGLIGSSTVGGGYMGRAIAGGMGRVMKGGAGQASSGAGRAGIGAVQMGGKAAEASGKALQAGAVANTISGGSGGSILASAGNALRGSAGGAEKVAGVLGKDITGGGRRTGK